MATALRKAAALGLLAFTLAAAKNTPSANQPIPKPECDSSITVSIRYSSVSSRVYIVSADGKTRGGCVSLSQIWELRRGKPPVYAVSSKSGDISNRATGTWLLTEDLYVQDGITLNVGLCFRSRFFCRFREDSTINDVGSTMLSSCCLGPK